VVFHYHCPLSDNKAMTIYGNVGRRKCTDSKKQPFNINIAIKHITFLRATNEEKMQKVSSSILVESVFIIQTRGAAF
jgi:hypothetical protein